MNERGVDRLVALLSNDQSGEIEEVNKPPNTNNMISITFKDGEVLVLTTEQEAGENPV